MPARRARGNGCPTENSNYYACFWWQFSGILVKKNIALVFFVTILHDSESCTLGKPVYFPSLKMVMNPDLVYSSWIAQFESGEEAANVMPMATVNLFLEAVWLCWALFTPLEALEVHIDEILQPVATSYLHSLALTFIPQDDYTHPYCWAIPQQCLTRMVTSMRMCGRLWARNDFSTCYWGFLLLNK